MLSNTQIEEIKELIASKQEGAYWDFKKEWYSEGKLGDLLHDIICMANNMENRDAYIIIGIDEENEYRLPWAMPYGQDEIDVMMKLADDILDWYDGMKNTVPKWYSK